MEELDIYDEDRRRTGRVITRGERLQEGEYRLAVHVCIFNSRDEMLIQQRQPFKAGWPNRWDMSLGGCATAGESSREAAEREAWEELGYRVDLGDIRPHLTVHFDVGFDDIYLVEDDVDLAGLRLQYQEVQAVKWCSEAEILEMIRAGSFIPYHPSLISLLFAMRKGYGGYSREE